MWTVSEVHKQWGNEKRECMCLSLSLRFSLGTIKDDEHEGSPSLHMAFFVEKDRRFYICKTKSGEVRNYKIWIKILILINININSKIITKGFRDLRR